MKIHNKITLNKILIGASIIGAMIAAKPSYEFLKEQYHKYHSKHLIEETEESRSRLESMIDSIGIVIGKNKFLLKKTEREDYISIIESAKRKMNCVADTLLKQHHKYLRKEYTTVESSLDEKKRLEQGINIKTVKVIANESTEQLDQIIKTILKKRQSRDAVWDNEKYIKAVLKKPIEIKAEDEDMGIIGPKYSSKVLIKNEKISNMLAILPIELQNSMGINLLSYLPELEHIQTVCSKAISEKATAMYNSAVDKYMRIKPENDRMEWYRPQKGDTIHGQASLDKLSAQQNSIITLIQDGNSRLTALEKYFDILHEQKIVYVSGHEKRSVRFRHTKSELVTSTKIGRDGGLEISTELETKTYYTDGYSFYYTERTITPEGDNTKEIFVGEKDEEDDLFYFNWNYPDEQKVGYITFWKKLHEEKPHVGGDYNLLQPRIMPLGGDCYSSRRGFQIEKQ